MGLRESIRYYLFGKCFVKVRQPKYTETVQIKEPIVLDSTKHDDVLGKDSMYLSKNNTYTKIRYLLDIGKTIICDLHDRNGLIGLVVLDIHNDFREETSIITLRGNERHKLYDKFLYNIIYDINKDTYSLQEQGEYFEKISIENNDN